MDFVAKAAETVKRVLELENLDNTSWTKVKETKDCTVYSRPSDDFKGHNLYKAEGIIPAAADKVFAFAYPGVERPRRKEWDSSITDSRVIEKPTPDIDIILSHTAPALMGIISAREFVDLIKVTSEPDRIFTAAVSIDHPNIPHSKNHVRGFNYPQSIFCYRIPGKPNETRFVQYVQTDLRGMLPSSAVESAIPSAMANTYPQLKTAIAKDAN
ncbi:stAR-related lipid transfer protein 5-like [Paramacrobiotus metropolitanus]|uniref:stAR-related lipid transfer protein 5-like n=1 Tax=Paramacrobiotus metropolitanus TaxID=2943436 RepID=UPI002445620D|nr:stAR-related lipid transfer protein 5-like [Paramacrobiotus metropolitanus]